MTVFLPGADVEKFAGDYTGPGIVEAVMTTADGRVRIVVSHKIEGGTGRFLHIYSPSQLRLRGPLRQREGGR